MTTYSPDRRNVKPLGGIISLLAKSRPVPGVFKGPPSIVAVLPGGQLYFDTALELDTDGWPGGADNGDGTHLEHTSLRYQDGGSVDANAVPYFVLPLPASWAHQFGISLGDCAAVLFRGNLTFATFADQGHADKLGEGSLALLRALGEERLRPDGSIIDAGTAKGVVTIVFPGSGLKGKLANESALLTRIAATKRLFDALAAPNPALLAAPVALTMPSLAEKIVSVTAAEFNKYQGCLEGDEPLCSRIGEYWKAVGNNDIDGSDHGSPWSAVFVSFMLRHAGAEDSFLYSSGHSHYVNRAIIDRSAKKTGRFWAYRPSETVIQPGDILAMNRGTSAPITYDYATEHATFDSHADIVVTTSATGLATIGGNVGAAPGTIGKKVFRWRQGLLLNAANDRQQVYAVLRPPVL